MVRIERSGQVATVFLESSREHESLGKRTGQSSSHGQLADAILELRADNNIRVIVITGIGDVFGLPPTDYSHHGNPGIDWDIMTGLTKCLEALVQTEKPIIARVNGPAIGFNSSIVFASDLIVARNDAVLADHHLATQGIHVDGKTVKGMGVVPGDGGSVFVPLCMSPAVSKEYLFLAKPITAQELWQMHVINYAVPADKLDETVKMLVDGLLKCSPYALAWAKRVVNRRIMENLNLTLDAGVAYEFLNLYMSEQSARQRGGERGVSSL